MSRPGRLRDEMRKIGIEKFYIESLETMNMMSTKNILQLEDEHKENICLKPDVFLLLVDHMFVRTISMPSLEKTIV